MMEKKTPNNKNPQPNTLSYKNTRTADNTVQRNRQIICLISCGLGGGVGEKGPLQRSPEGMRHILHTDLQSA